MAEKTALASTCQNIAREPVPLQGIQKRLPQWQAEGFLNLEWVAHLKVIGVVCWAGTHCQVLLLEANPWLMYDHDECDNRKMVIVR